MWICGCVEHSDWSDVRLSWKRATRDLQNGWPRKVDYNDKIRTEIKTQMFQL